jgi:hypothetical protein
LYTSAFLDRAPKRVNLFMRRYGTWKETRFSEMRNTSISAGNMRMIL